MRDGDLFKAGLIKDEPDIPHSSNDLLFNAMVENFERLKQLVLKKKRK